MTDRARKPSDSQGVYGLIALIVVSLLVIAVFVLALI